MQNLQFFKISDSLRRLSLLGDFLLMPNLEYFHRWVSNTQKVRVSDTQVLIR